MKKKLPIGIFLRTIITALVTISLSACSNDDEIPGFEGDEVLGSEVYMFKYEDEYTYLREILRGMPTDEDHFKSEYPDFESKYYKTNLGDTHRIVPKIVIIVEDESKIDMILSQFGDKLSFKNKLGRCFIYNCHVKTSDEVMRMVTILAKDKRVIGCEADCVVKIEFWNL